MNFTPFRKIISLITALSAAAAMCACDTGAQPDISETSVEAAASGSTAEAVTEAVTEPRPEVPPMDTSPITLSLFIFGDHEENPFSDAAAERITAETGVTLEITVFPDDSPLDILAETEDLPDLIYAGEDTGSVIENGYVISLDEYLYLYGENFTALYGSNFGSLEEADGSVYTFGTGGSSEPMIFPEGTFQIRHDVLAEMEYPEITTLEQLEACISEYMENHPNNSGLLLCGAPQQQWEKTISERVNYVLGFPDDGEFIVNEETLEAEYKWLLPGAEEYVKWLNHMYNEGLLDDQSFSLREGPYHDRISGGRVIALAGCPEEFSHMYCPLSVTLESGGKTMFTADYGNYDVPAGIAITSGCSEPERAFRFLDWWCSDHAQDIIAAEYDEESFYELYSEPFPMRSITARDSGGNYYSPRIAEIASEYSKEERATLEGYGITLFADLFPRTEELPPVRRTLISELEIPAMSMESIYMETLETYMKTEVENAITCSEEEFDEKWAEITAWCENNGARELEELIAG